MTRRDPHGRPDRERFEARTHLQRGGQGTAGQPQLGVAHRHLEEGAHHAIDRGAPEERGDLGLFGQLPASGRRRIEDPLHPPGVCRRLDLVHPGVHRRALTQRGALPPSLRIRGHHPHEEQAAGPVHAGRRADVHPERDVEPDQLETDQLHDVLTV